MLSRVEEAEKLVTVMDVYFPLAWCHGAPGSLLSSKASALHKFAQVANTE